ncbi:MAG TPA: RNA methyltransferase [Candidatus Saccharimonadales bacterium]|nr:RNA methyltransferase [Candidatus Saccharimonadales bacterium]
MPVRDRIRKVKHLQNKYFICVLENPKDIVNIASAIRNISAFGVEKLYVVGTKEIVKDFETSRNDKHLTNMSVGSNKWVFVKRFDTAADCIAHLLKERFTIAVTSSHLKGKQNVNLYEASFTQKRLAVWFGNESKGISQEVAEAADLCIQIPMGGIVESLNLGTSTGIILSYISYQRLRYIYENNKAYFKPRSIADLKMQSWEEFIKPNR